jgi:hypothetical protein
MAANDDIEVTADDQNDINAFSRINTKRHEYLDDLKAKEVCK